MPIATSGWWCVQFRDALAYMELVDPWIWRLGSRHPVRTAFANWRE